MNILEDTMLIYRVAKNYYIDGYGQNEIARMIGISRPQISRLIKKGLELGIVKIEVNLPETLSVKELEKQLKECLGIMSVAIIPSNVIDGVDNFYVLAAKYLSESLAGYQRVGLGWGRSMYELSRHIDYETEKSEMVFFPLIGCSGNNNPYLQINSITDRFAERYRARACYLNIPVFRKENDVPDEDDKQLSIFQKEWESLDAAVVGVGAFQGEDQFYIQEVAYDSFLMEHKKYVVADILSNLLTKDGSILELPGYRHVAYPVDALIKIPKIIAVAKGGIKTDAIYCVASHGYINSLITDENTAKSIINKHGFKQRV